MKLSIQWLLITVIDVTTTRVVGYITSGLPGHTHRAWLKQESCDLCELPAGDLTPEMCTKAPQLLSAWAQNPYISHAEQQHQNYQDIFPHHGKECALECERLLKRLVDERRAGNANAVATTAVYNSLMGIWARSGEHEAAAQRAEDILVSMQDAYIAGATEVQPDLDSFKVVINAWSKAVENENDAAQRAQRVLEWMMKLYKSGGNDFARPDLECFEIVLHAWAKSQHPDAPQKAEDLMTLLDISYLEGSATVKPTRTTFNQLLTIWSKSTKPEAAQRAEDILHHMKRMSCLEGYEDMKPNTFSYKTLISTWARKGSLDSARRADNILKQAVDQEKESKEECTDAIMFNIVADAYAKSSSNKAHLKSRAVLSQQREFYASGHKRCRPDVYSFSSVLGSCASLTGSRKERLQAFDVARLTFRDMRLSNVTPNHVTYGTMLKACSRLLPMGKERVRYTKEYFKMACINGCAGDMVMRRFEESASVDQYQGLMKGVTRDNLPSEWTYAVPSNDNKGKHNKNTQGKVSKLKP